MAPFQCTCEPATNPLPLTVKVRSGDPPIAVAGVREAIAGVGLITLNVAVADVPPPGAEFTTVTAAVPAVAASVAVIAAVSCVRLENVVTRFVPFH